jgi:hypothetical protein
MLNNTAVPAVVKDALHSGLPSGMIFIGMIFIMRGGATNF